MTDNPVSQPTEEYAALEAALAVHRPWLDSMRTRIFIADKKLVIRFANKLALETIEYHGGVFRETFNVRPGEILGGSIHRFHKDPGRVERLLATALPHQAVFQFAGVTLSTNISALPGPSGETIGYVVCWEDRTSATRILDASAGSLTEAAAAAAEISQVGEETAAAAQDAALAASEAREHTETSSARIAELELASREISKVVDNITAIARQTKLLALNAAIEAAHAGDSGRGFAVVADEVKKLAADADNAAQLIAAKINEISSKVRGSLTALEGIAARVTTIDDVQTRLWHASREQASALAQLTSRISEAAAHAQEVRNNI